MPNITLEPYIGIVGLAFTIVGILLTLLVTRWTNRKSLAYELLIFEPVLTVKNIEESKITVLYDGVPVNSITLALVKVVNNGYKEILAADYERMLSFDAGPGTEIVSAETMAANPLNLTPIITIGQKHKRSAVYLEPLLLNRNESIYIKLLIKGTPSKLIPDARIAGVRKIEQFPSTYKNLKIFVLVSWVCTVFFIFMAITGQLSGWAWQDSPLWVGMFLVVVILFLFSVGGLAGTMILLITELRRTRSGRR